MGDFFLNAIFVAERDLEFISNEKISLRSLHFLSVKKTYTLLICYGLQVADLA